MHQLFAPEPERFIGFAPEPAMDRELLNRLVAHDALDPAHLFMVHNGESDVGRLGLQRYADGTVSTYGWLIDPSHEDLETAFRLLLEGVGKAAADSGITRIETTVVTRLEPAPDAKLAALAAAGWTVEGTLCELEAYPAETGDAPGIEEISPEDDRVVAVMAAAMSDSLDQDDNEQVAAHGATTAATHLRDSILDTPRGVWYAHRGVSGIDGIAAVERTDHEWTVSYIGVRPDARGRSVGASLVSAVLAAATTAGIPRVGASVGQTNRPARMAFERAGFTEWSTSYDYALNLTPTPDGA
ncbi:MAG TPA: GNAT family N-acetyltransferase [Candidatus Stackebrandtia excrementipullorum]|nr:GNAT family N-acetyltransferase [Candidatus Stackebrandtia excrementipullorum]